MEKLMDVTRQDVEQENRGTYGSTSSVVYYTCDIVFPERYIAVAWIASESFGQMKSRDKAGRPTVTMTEIDNLILMAPSPKGRIFCWQCLSLTKQEDPTWTRSDIGAVIMKWENN